MVPVLQRPRAEELRFNITIVYPCFEMPALIRKLVVSAAVDGLVLQPHNQREQRTNPGLQIRYTRQGSATLTSAPNDDLAKSATLEIYGVRPIQGLLNIASASYLISILRRQQVAQIRGSPVYVITSVALIPLCSQSDAEKAIVQTNREVQARTSQQEAEEVSMDSPSSANEDSEGHVTDDGLRQPKALTPTGDVRPKSQKGKDSVAQDVIGRKGQYGRFAESWFSRKGWSTERRRAQGMSATDTGKSKGVLEEQKGSVIDPEEKVENDGSGGKGLPNVPAQGLIEPGASRTQDVISTLLPKLLRTTRMLFASRSFFFSYDYDITRKLGDQKMNASNVPLYRCVDPLVCDPNDIRNKLRTLTSEQFFWNHHLILPFIENGDHAYVLPLMQGFVGQRSFRADPTPSEDQSNVILEAQQAMTDVIEIQNQPEAASTFLLTLISRRSIKRPGLRYLRRGIDEEGYAANSVETEQILSRTSWAGSEKTYSFTQFRGSIPLYFSQSPYAFKPVPSLQHSFKTNHDAFNRHFTNLIDRYGDVQIVLLVDKHGGEAEIGQNYEEHLKSLVAGGGIDEIKPAFEWFDFHAVCRGMKFENVEVLIHRLNDTLDSHGTTIEVNGEVQKQQKGVIRTNCMDCLDRTNVVQSACASRALEKQLKNEGAEVNLQTDTTTQWFNTLWADNKLTRKRDADGDAISRQYSSTAALKGDYTRTRKRDYRGALNDFGLTLSRYYNNIVNDYFSQAAIDFLLGNVTEQVFEEFEADMMSNDPAISMRKVRANAIDTSAKIVIAEQHEDLIGGWTLLSPKESNTLRTFPFEEVILLLTDAALYAVRFDWNLEKVSSFERVDLRSLSRIYHGSYITSTMTAIQTDENKNVGIVIQYRPGKEDIARVNTRSLSTAVPTDTDPDSPSTTTAMAKLFNSSESGLSSPQRQPKSSAKDNQAPRILAFKALPSKTSLANVGEREADTATISEKELVNSICEDIRRATYGGDGGGSDTGFGRDFVEEKDIISLKEARSSTGYLERGFHELKKFVWA
ncbi:MAG: hypothetical protein Q9169_005316 [Polycauliona sp. 2 TL-2023]